MDIRGRSRTLHINYRTSHQIARRPTDCWAPEVSDVDGNTEERRGTISVFNGPAPEIRVLKSLDEESQTVGEWLRDRSNEGVVPHEIGVFVRSTAELDRARAAVEKSGLPFKVLDENVETTDGHVSISTMHLAKGLEFRAVVVMACDDEIIPLQATHRNGGRRRRSGRGLQHRTPPALRRLHPRAGSSARDERRTASEFLDDLRHESWWEENMAKKNIIDPIVEIKELVEELAHEEVLQPDEAFILWFIRSHLLEEPIASRNCLTRRGNEKGVDAIYIDHAARQVNIIQGKYRTKGIGKAEPRQDVMQLATYGRLMSQEEDNLAALAEGADVFSEREAQRSVPPH